MFAWASSGSGMPSAELLLVEHRDLERGDQGGDGQSHHERAAHDQ
jgi:hypothetical protein